MELIIALCCLLLTIAFWVWVITSVNTVIKHLKSIDEGIASQKDYLAKLIGKQHETNSTLTYIRRIWAQPAAPTDDAGEPE